MSRDDLRCRAGSMPRSPDTDYKDDAFSKQLPQPARSQKTFMTSMELEHLKRGLVEYSV